MRFLCSLFGHRPLHLQAMNGADLFTVRDSLGQLLVAIHLCERCHVVFWEAR